MPSPSTTSLILFENRRVTRSMTKLAARGCAAAVIVRRPLAERTASVNLEAPLSVARKSSPVNRPAAKPPLSYKAGFGFTLGGSARTPEERERLRKERLAFSRRGGAYQERKDLPAVKVWVASALSRDQVLSPDMFFLVPGVRELAPHEWDEWRPTRRPEHNQGGRRVQAVRPPDVFIRQLVARRLEAIRKARIRQKASGQGARCGQGCSPPFVGSARRIRSFASSEFRANAQAPFQVAWSVLKLACWEWSTAKRRAVCAFERLMPHSGPELIFILYPQLISTFGQGVIGVSACKAQEVHSGRGCIFSLAKSTPGTGQCGSNASSSIRRASGLTEGEVHSGRGCASSSVGLVFGRARCAPAIGDPLLSLFFLQYFMRLIALFGGIVREQGPLAPSSGFLPVMMGLIRMQLAPQVLPREIRRVSASWAKEYTLAERGFSLISSGDVDQHPSTLWPRVVLWRWRQNFPKRIEFLKAGPTLRIGLLGNGGAPWPRVCPSLLMRTALDASRGISRTGCGRESRPSRRRTLSGREMRFVSCDVSFFSLPGFKHSLIDQTAGARMRRACSTARGTGSEGRPSSRKAFDRRTIQIPIRSMITGDCRERNIAIDYGDLSASSFRTYSAWGPTAVPGLDWTELYQLQGAHPIKTSSYLDRSKVLPPADWIAGLGLVLLC
ncbi:hypothetical protein EDB86DRAFT_2830901 [Lactarius hatsudake]|nr:hypothetical protein EDB86DRAFT_2830901 [Lactarius hatsudake]